MDRRAVLKSVGMAAMSAAAIGFLVVFVRVATPFFFVPGGFGFEWLGIHPVKAITERFMAPLNISGCMRCMRPWALSEQTISYNSRPFMTEKASKGVKGHATTYRTDRAMFPLCEECWSSLKPEERLPYYKRLYDSWDKDDLTWDEVEEAVLGEEG